MGLYVVTGPPASGKSTWVRSKARPGDIVIDYDVLAGALTAPGGEPYDHPRHLKHVTFRARSAAITEALKHTADVDVYVIHSLLSAEALSRYEEHHAELITIDPGYDVVMRRVAEQRPQSMRSVAERWYSTSNHTEQPPARSSRVW